MSPPLLSLANNAVQFRVAVTPLNTKSLDYQRGIFSFRSVKTDHRLLFPTVSDNFPLNRRGESLIWPNQPIVKGHIYNVTEIGRGAMGSVTHVVDKVKKRAFALKTVLPKYAKNLHWEIRLMRRMSRVTHVCLYGYNIAFPLSHQTPPPSTS